MIELETGDEVVAAFPHHDFVFVITRRGYFYKICGLGGTFNADDYVVIKL